MGKSFKRPLDIVLVVVLGLLLISNGFFIFSVGLVVVTKNVPTNPGVVIMVVVAALLEFLFWWLIRSPFRRLRPSGEGEVHPNGLRYAGFGARFAAGLIDMIVFMPFWVLPYFLSSWDIRKFEIYFWGSYLYYPYIVFMVSRYGQTLGKMVVGITVFLDDGSPVTLKASLKRSSIDLLIGAVLMLGHLYALSKIDLGFGFGKFQEAYNFINKANPASAYVTFISFAWFISEYLTLLFNKRKKAIHDFIGGTVVLAKAKVK